MRGLAWVKSVLASQNSDDRTYNLAIDAVYAINTPSRIARKAREYIAAREAFESQLAKNGIYVS